MDHIQARKSLDRKLKPLSEKGVLTRPHRGWVRAIREAIGMTGTQLANRIGVSQSRITSLEKAEADDSITLASLRRAAEALDCSLVYAIVPKSSLEDMVSARARARAEKILKRVDHTMALEKQNLDKSELEEQIADLAREILTKKTRLLWQEERE